MRQLDPFAGWFALICAAVSGTAVAQEDGLPELEPGLTLRVYDIGRPMEALAPLREDQTPNVDRRLGVLDLRTDADFGGPTDHFVVEALGYLKIDEPGSYGFELISDDGSELTIAGTLVVRHDGLHAPSGKTGVVTLAAGLHPFRVDMFENSGGAALTLRWRPPGADGFATVPASAFRIEKGLTRVVSPGRKRILDGKDHLRPGDGMPLDAVHPMWTVEHIRPETPGGGHEHRIGAMDFLPDGSLVYAHFVPVNNGVLREEPNGTIWQLDGVDGHRGRSDNPARPIAAGFHDPSGIVCVGTDIFVSHRPGIERLRDLDGDGAYETRETFAEPWVGNNYHHFSFGLQHHADADGEWISGALSTSIYFNNTLDHDDVQGEVIGMAGPNPPNRGTCYRINLETREIEWLAGGLRTPNGVHVDSRGRVFVTDNQGAWHPGNRLNHVPVGDGPGRFYGHYNGLQVSNRFPEGGTRANFMERGEWPPAVWLPQNEVANSPTTPLEILEGPFAGQYWLAELTAGGIRRVFLEEVNGELQGAVFRHTQGLECGVNRLVRGTDGCLYAGGTGADGNWNWRGTQHGLQRLRPTGETALEMHSIRAVPDGFVIRFTEPVDPAVLAMPEAFEITRWDYFSTAEYGGPKRHVQRLVATRAIAGGGQTAVRLIVPGLRAGSVVHIRCREELGFGEMWSPEAWYTLNQIPTGQRQTLGDLGVIRPIDRWTDGGFSPNRGGWARAGGVVGAGDRLARVTQPPLGDGPGTPSGPVIVNGDGWTSDLETLFEHGDAEVHVEFMVPEGSNSGVYFQGRYEIQILDSHGLESPRHDHCGGIYQRWDPARGEGNEGFEGHGPRVNAAAPAGEWQSFDVVFRAPRFDPYGNKTADARFELVRHNGVVIHENVELTGPTRAGHEGEVPFASLRLQGDHGPVAYRNIRVRPLPQRFPSWPGESQVEQMSVLVFSKTAGFRHSSIPDGIACFRELAREHGFRMDATEDSGVFSPTRLSGYDVVVFLNTTGDVLDDDQQRAFESWYRGGGGYLGVHSASDTEYDWPWYGRLVGAYFNSHPRIQPARLVVLDREHPATAHLGGFPHFNTWTRTDEWYDFRAQPARGIHRLLGLDASTYAGGRIGTDDSPRREHPIAWCHEFDGGRAIYTGGGHTEASYAEPGFRQHLLGSVLWAAGLSN